jgi:DedD protein
MERELKERIIGAVVLVLVVVLVVPIFLDGRTDHDETVTESVVLPGQSEQKMQTQVLDRNRSTPVPASSSNDDAPQPEAAAAEPQPVPEPRREEPTPVAAQQPVTKPVSQPEEKPVVSEPVATSSTGMFAVQLGSFGSEENATKLAADLRKQDFAAFLSKLESNGKELHRVRVGPQANREAAEAVAAKLAKAGHKGQVVPHP